MTAELLPLRLLLTVPAALGAWAAVALLVRLLRLREPRVVAALCALGVLDVVLTAFGRPLLAVVLVHVIVPEARRAELLGTCAAPALCAWGGVAAVLVVRRLVRARRASQLARALALLHPADAELATRARRAAARAGVADVRVALVPGDATPCAVGPLRPTVLVPQALWARLPDDARDALLLHELAHVRRRDGLRLLLLGLLCDVLFFNWPLRRLTARWSACFEELADRAALRGGATLVGLARSVAAGLDAAVGAPRLALAIGGARGGAARRLEHALRPTRRRVLALQLVALALLVPATPPGAGGASARVADAPHGSLMLGLSWRGPPWTAALLPHLSPR